MDDPKQICPLLAALKALPEYNRLSELLKDKEGPAAAYGLPEAHRAHVSAALASAEGGLAITASEQSADRFYEQAAALMDNVARFPAREIPLVNAYAVNSDDSKRRIATLVKLSMGEPVLVVASVEAAMQTLAPPKALKAAINRLCLGEQHPPRELLTRLFDAGYETVELVEGPGQVSLRGDIVDVFPPNAASPIRIEFFDDEIDRMSLYDPQTQRSIERVDEAVIPPATEAPQDKTVIERALKAIQGAKGFDAQRIAFEEGRAAYGAEALLPLLYERVYSIFDHLKKGAICVIEEPHNVMDAAETSARLFMGNIRSMLERGEGLVEQAKLLLSTEELVKRLNTGRTALLFTLTRSFARIRPRESVQFDARPAPRYIDDKRELARDVDTLKRTGNAVLLYAGEHAGALSSLLKEEGVEAGLADAAYRLPEQGEALIVKQSMPMGMLYPALRLTVLTEAELYGHVRTQAVKRRHKGPRLVFGELSPGDLVVHESHGIARFVGVQALTVQDTTRDYLLMEYAGGDRLYIPTDQLDRVQKYVGGDDAPKLSKLGGNEWHKQVSRARNAVKELAFDLASLYAKREQSRGFAFSPDSVWQRQLEECFPFTETPDQLQSIEEVKRDMESPRVMDRLLVGDVGYGKTEVALRAAFKAVQDSKQTAILVPTTILAQQHYNTLSTRFAGFPVKVELMSRFRSAQEIKRVKQALKEGSVDIVVGTHALLAKDMGFKDLGLLIIDEEQRFGVGHKEIIKTLKSNVDVLTLTATPIPRTLHMSMIGIRDMSVIDTPPEERYPVQTYVLEYTDTLLCDALLKELSRGGQAYVVYNQVRRLERFAEHISLLLPQARVAVAHGQMPESLLEQVMMDYLEHRYDVLLCSTIIESGLDIQNSNTLIVIDADKMGLSQLYQLRGRVGRSTRLGYAYFTIRKDKALTEIAHKRLTALTEFTQFGAGREIALRDLEIRGAGSLLGAHQHGHIVDIGYEYYCKLMAGAVNEAKGGQPLPPVIDTNVDIPLDAHIPRHYIASEVQRLSMYKRIALISDRGSHLDVQEEMLDRYGDIPEATQNLMDVALLKACCAQAQITSLTVREGSAKLVFHQEAALDGAALIQAVSAYGAKLNPGDTVSLSLIRSNAPPNEMVRLLLPLLESLRGACT